MAQEIEQMDQNREDLNEAMNEYLRHIKPSLTDFNLIPRIYEAFTSRYGGKPDTERRSQLIFVIVFLYSPRRFYWALPKFKNRIIKGVVLNVCKALGMPSSNVARSFGEAFTRYHAFREYRESTNRIYSDIVDSLRSSGVPI